VTLKEEMSSITRSFVLSRAKRSGEINEMKQSLARQIKEGKASADLMSSELHETIQIDLKRISEYVSSNRDAVSSLLLSYKAGRKASTKALRARLVVDRISLSSKVKKILLGFAQDHNRARASILGSAASSKSKVKPSNSTSTEVKVNNPTPAAVKTNSPTPAAVKTNSQTPAAVKTNSQTPAAVKTNSQTPAAVKANSQTPAAVKANSQTPAAVKTNNPIPAAVKTNSPPPAAVRTNSPTPAAVKSNSPTPAAFPFKTNNPKK
jgi:uncharacterized protein YheU (UPF0270 family)